MKQISTNSIIRLFAAIFCLIILIIPFFCPALLIANDKSTENNEDIEFRIETIIYADLFIKGFKDCRVELYVNGFPVGRAGGGLQPYIATPVPEFLIDGKNKLEVVLGTGATPSTALDGEASCIKAVPQMKVTARIVKFKDGEMTGPGTGETLMEIEWSGETEDAFPKIISKVVDLGKLFGEWKWQTAEKLTLDEATKKSAIEFIKMIQKNYANCKPEEIVKFAKFKHEEAVRSYPAYGDIDFNEMLIEQLKEMAEHPKWIPGELPVEDYDLRLIAGGKVIEAVAKDWRPIIRMAGGDFGYPMMIGRIDGNWQILR
jgi:hypothetical protein